eukprot:scaffold33284_cov69-Phaeocystis_antarctica.AAC.3
MISTSAHTRKGALPSHLLAKHGAGQLERPRRDVLDRRGVLDAARDVVLLLRARRHRLERAHGHLPAPLLRDAVVRRGVRRAGPHEDGHAELRRVERHLGRHEDTDGVEARLCRVDEGPAVRLGRQVVRSKE